jgi:hypothetical protein
MINLGKANRRERYCSGLLLSSQLIVSNDFAIGLIGDKNLCTQRNRSGGMLSQDWHSFLSGPVQRRSWLISGKPHIKT